MLFPRRDCLLKEVAARKGGRSTTAAKVCLREITLTDRLWGAWRGVEEAEARSYLHGDLDDLKLELQDRGEVPIVVP